MSSDMDSRGIIFELQWRKKHGIVYREEDIASLGIWDTDPALDWVTFKSYLSQNLGTSDDISVAYVDSEGDELPIESECEFHEALKFARQQTRKGRKIVLKVDKKGVLPSPATDSGEGKRLWKATRCGKRMSTSDKAGIKDDKKQSQKPIYHLSMRELVDLVQNNDKMVHEKLENITKIQEQQRKGKSEKDDHLSPTLKKYLQKMKNEIVGEITTNMRLMLTNLVLSPPSHPVESRVENVPGVKSKKRISDEDSSDAALGSDQRDHKLLRKIEKLHKREKKLEKKLDSKLEKLENKTKRMMEKKSQGKLRTECYREPDKKSSRKRSGDGPVGTYLMDAILLNDGPKAETHIKLGKRFTKIWEIMNNGTIPWTDKTELRLAWGTLGLEPEEAVVKCPILEPGEKGQIAVNFRAPDFPGTFESYWHFYHMGERFGHWVGCAVVVEEPNKSIKVAVAATADRYGQGALKKTYLNLDKEGHGNFEKLDNLDGNSDHLANDPSSNENLDNIEKENNIEKIDVAVDLSLKNNAENCGYVPVDANQPNNNNINVVHPDRQAQYVPGADECDAALEGSDYDNLSLFSGVSDNDTDTDDDDDTDKFVIVPMPACFMRDVPLGSESVPVLVKDSKARHSSAADHSASADFPASPATKPPEGMACEAERDEEFLSLPSSSGEPDVTEAVEEEEEEAQEAKAETYAVDAQGSCIPLQSAWPASPATKIPMGYAAKPCSSPKRKQANSKTTSTSSSTSFKASHFTQASQTFSYGGGGSSGQSFESRSESGSASSAHQPRCFAQATSYCHNSAFPKAGGMFSHASGTFPRAHGTFSQGHGDNGQGNGTFPPGKVSKSQAESTTQTGAADGPVHILPETIVNGAINVATSALNTARTVLSNFRSSPSPARSGPNEEPILLAALPMDEALKMLADMGFCNRAANVQLLYRYDNDVAKVVSELVKGSSPGLFENGQ